MLIKITKSHLFSGLLLLLTTIICFAALPSRAAEPQAVVHDIATSTIKEVKISPNGDYIALRVADQEGLSLKILDRKSLAQLGELEFALHQEIGNFFWASKDRVVAEVIDATGSYSGKLLAINFDGTQKALIQDNIQSKNTRALKVVDPLPDNYSHVLISSEPLISENGHRGTAILLNIYGDLGNSEFAQTALPAIQDQDLFVDLEGEIQIAQNL